MHVSTDNPTKNPAKAGKHSRFALNTQALRHFSSDTTTERAIVTLREWLAGRVASGDVVSVSLLARRAIAVYLSHCEALCRTGDLTHERGEIRKGSRMPNPHPHRKRKPSLATAKKHPAQTSQKTPHGTT